MNSEHIQGEYRPVWLRWTTVALATLALSACQGPTWELTDRPMLAELGSETTARPGSVDPQPASALVPVTRQSGSQPTQPTASQIGFKVPVTATQTDATTQRAVVPVGGPVASDNGVSTIQLAHVPAALPEQVDHSANPIGQDESCHDCTSTARCSCDLPLPRLADEWVCDGGDFGLPVGIRKDYSVDGLEQEDTVAHYETFDGKTLVQPSNRVCIYAPRFAVVRRVVNPMGHLHLDVTDSVDLHQGPALADERRRVSLAKERHAPNINRRQQNPSRFRARQQAGGIERLRRVAEMQGILSAYADLFVVRAGIMVNHEKPRLAQATTSAIRWTAVQGAQVLVDNREVRAVVSERQAALVFRLDEPEKSCLRLLKLCSRPDAQPGETIEFTLRFDNIGCRTVNRVAIVDNLSTRLEYVPETARSSLDATFSTYDNGTDSLVLRWELDEPLPPGRGGILQFRCLVR